MATNKTVLYTIDSSVIISYLLPDETLPSTIKSLIKRYLANKIDFTAPPLLKYEVGNCLKSAIKQKRLDSYSANEIYSTFLNFPIRYLSPHYSNTLQISLQYDLSFYDASYLSLSQEKNAPLLTLDEKLKSVISPSSQPGRS